MLSENLLDVQDGGLQHLEKLQALVSSLIGGNDGNLVDTHATLEAESGGTASVPAAAKAAQNAAKKQRRRLKR